MEVPQAILDRFTTEAKSRGEDPNDALEQLMIDYIAGRDHDALLEEVHDNVVINDQAATATDGGQTATDTSAQSTTRPTNSISDYDPEDDARLTRTAMEVLPDIDEPVEVDPDDVPKGAIPGAVGVKQALVEAVVRYENDAVSRDGVASVADELLDVGSDYKERQYVDKVMDRFPVYVDGEQLERTFVSVEAAMEWMDDRIEEDGAYAEEDVRDVIVELYTSHGVDADVLQPHADECRLGSVADFVE